MLGPARDGVPKLEQAAHHLALRPSFQGRQMMRDWSVTDRLGEIRVPTLVLAGRGDFLIPPSARLRSPRAFRRPRLQIIERAGHNPQSERPAETLRAVANFLALSPEPRQPQLLLRS